MNNLQPAADAHHFLAPAKLNLDLRIVGRRADGYHLLESIFTLITLYDQIWFKINRTGSIKLHTPVAGIEPEEDLCVRAAQLLRRHTGTRLGVDIWLDKQIPIGGGLGGGSADAAVVLMALNRLWQLELNKTQLLQLGVQLGADVPFFIFGQSAFARGIGEDLSPIILPKQWYVIIKPPVHVSTPKIFAHKDLTRDSKPRIMPDFQAEQHWRNDMQSVVLAEYPAVKVAFDVLAEYGSPMMSGSGACVFLPFDSENAAQAVYNKVFYAHQAYCVASLAKHPFYQ
ncbi:4-(cytidine 5'-diphospho)-2-C-methyl-D-erythritol kinase [Snodgrassella communis]|jgi:4-diphosphocytidyl-2-C-methyl-D-erythritol kinase|uniref:4-diphosphocytidyl-2-C-methyl-D-erythritol kinase n=1 Tax=Snodgrassella communis TaxID=2946699 RepID=A0A836Z5Z8_9NEIS|nr:4-(cytidine 5'-diphospho)-2-C-methyl-D-erythritol kinase [Snodgrassella communis]KDN14680.1 4-diphosphocytidyl-2-C-methyl-D-erythritol kinase [Snodgrassella communis]PIT07595.1 4-(cytidine 5'-diphospho)-2-C-methyl-D-erythritol kinase [Snodgrassella communis]PIT20154.1 4-(cytidine 5'-diphospho)-2-C-methyl-D-erythritol kinase [Snodgrassella communis]PIT20309.1 4-(cytidine 5'-diphospho)-2-C-methyl-D-erythritol kinase [Snodgrassella communis]PIT28000.1 4-(cytidine 5'-diphospho)-2-C-methyl-D-ery